MALAAQDKTLFVSSLISDGERTPLFTDNAEYASIHENYGKTTGKITYVGEKNMYRLGEQSRDRFINSGFLPLSYDPTTVFVRWPSDNVSILSGYSYIMGMYPTTIEGVDLMRGFDELTTVPISESEINNVRQEIGVSRPECGDQRLDVYPGNSDREFLIKPMSLYPGQKDLIKRKINDAKDDFERMYSKRLYQALAEAMNKDPNYIIFSNAIFYLDDYITAKANGQRIPYTLDPQTEDLINEYYTYYYERGIFGDHAVARLFTSSYFTNLGKELLSKHTALTEGQDNDKFIRNLKHSIHVGNDQTFVAIMHQLGECHNSRLSFSLQIKLENVNWNEQKLKINNGYKNSVFVGIELAITNKVSSITPSMHTLECNCIEHNIWLLCYIYENMSKAKWYLYSYRDISSLFAKFSIRIHFKANHLFE